MKHAQKGFTLIEIMIVVAIIAILAAVAIPNFISYRKTAQKNSCLSTQDTIATAAEAYLVAHPGATTVAITDLYKTDGTGYLKTKTEPLCPDGSSKYTITITDGIVSITCSNGETDADYKHSKATPTPTPTPAG